MAPQPPSRTISLSKSMQFPLQSDLPITCKALDTSTGRPWQVNIHSPSSLASLLNLSNPSPPLSLSLTEAMKLDVEKAAELPKNRNILRSYFTKLPSQFEIDLILQLYEHHLKLLQDDADEPSSIPSQIEIVQLHYLETCSSGSLLTLLSSLPSPLLPLPIAATFTEQIVSGLSFLHSHNFTCSGGSGLSCSNVMIGKGNSMKLSNYTYTYTSTHGSSASASMQSADFRSIGRLTLTLIGAKDINQVTDAGAKSFVSECFKGGKTSTILRHPWLRRATMIANPTSIQQQQQQQQQPPSPPIQPSSPPILQGYITKSESEGSLANISDSTPVTFNKSYKNVSKNDQEDDEFCFDEEDSDDDDVNGGWLGGALPTVTVTGGGGIKEKFLTCQQEAFLKNARR